MGGRKEGQLAAPWGAYTPIPFSISSGVVGLYHRDLLTVITESLPQLEVIASSQFFGINGAINPFF